LGWLGTNKKDVLNFYCFSIVYEFIGDIFFEKSLQEEKKHFTFAPL